MNENNSKSTSRTDWTALDAITDEDIDYSDIPPLTDEFFENATLRIPAKQASSLIQIEPEILQWFQEHSKDYKTLVNSALRRYIEEYGSQQAS